MAEAQPDGVGVTVLQIFAGNSRCAAGGRRPAPGRARPARHPSDEVLLPLSLLACAMPTRSSFRKVGLVAPWSGSGLIGN